MNDLIENVIVQTSELHSDINATQLRDIGETVFAIVDKEGHVFDFDNAWQWAGYCDKATGKQVLTKNFVVDQDFVITQQSAANLNQEITGFKNKGKHGGHKKSEKIMLTSKCFLKFCFLARTSTGDVLRDFVIALIRGVKALRDEVRSGRIELKRVTPAPEDTTHATKRIKTCESVKSLMSELKEKNVSGDTFARVNGATNQTVMGFGRAKLASDLGRPVGKVNCRDHMSVEQLSAVELIEILSRKVIHGTTTENALNAHDSVCQKFTSMASLLHGTHEREGKKLRDARIEKENTAEIKALITDVAQAVTQAVVAALPPPVQAAPTHNNNATTMNIRNYFGVKS